MSIKVTVTTVLDVPEDLNADLRDNWGVGLQSWMCEQFEVALSQMAKDRTGSWYTITGMRIKAKGSREPFETGMFRGRELK